MSAARAMGSMVVQDLVASSLSGTVNLDFNVRRRLHELIQGRLLSYSKLLLQKGMRR